MKESDLNYIIKTNFNTPKAWCHKISDPPKLVTQSVSKNPFDLFGVTDTYIFYFESKLLKGYQAFSFSKIQEHQCSNLLSIKNITVNIPNIYTCIVVGVWESRQYFHLYFFDISYISMLIKKGKKSILKKDLFEFQNDNKYLKIEKKYFDITKIPEIIIK